jgi:hypothetical protein
MNQAQENRVGNAADIAEPAYIINQPGKAGTAYFGNARLYQVYQLLHIGSG